MENIAPKKWMIEELWRSNYFKDRKTLRQISIHSSKIFGTVDFGSIAINENWKKILNDCDFLSSTQKGWKSKKIFKKAEESINPNNRLLKIAEAVRSNNRGSNSSYLPTPPYLNQGEKRKWLEIQNAQSMSKQKLTKEENIEQKQNILGKLISEDYFRNSRSLEDIRKIASRRFGKNHKEVTYWVELLKGFKELSKINGRWIQRKGKKNINKKSKEWIDPRQKMLDDYKKYEEERNREDNLRNRKWRNTKKPKAWGTIEKEVENEVEKIAREAQLQRRKKQSRIKQLNEQYEIGQQNSIDGQIKRARQSLKELWRDGYFEKSKSGIDIIKTAANKNGYISINYIQWKNLLDSSDFLKRGRGGWIQKKRTLKNRIANRSRAPGRLGRGIRNQEKGPDDAGNAHRTARSVDKRTGKLLRSARGFFGARKTLYDQGQAHGKGADARKDVDRRIKAARIRSGTPRRLWRGFFGKEAGEDDQGQAYGKGADARRRFDIKTKGRFDRKAKSRRLDRKQNKIDDDKTVKIKKVIKQLWSYDFFTEPRSIPFIHRELKSRISNYSVDSIILNRVMNECDFLQNRNGLWIQKKRTLKNRIANRSRAPGRLGRGIRNQEKGPDDAGNAHRTARSVDKRTGKLLRSARGFFGARKTLYDQGQAHGKGADARKDVDRRIKAARIRSGTPRRLWRGFFGKEAGEDDQGQAYGKGADARRRFDIKTKGRFDRKAKSRRLDRKQNKIDDDKTVKIKKVIKQLWSYAFFTEPRSIPFIHRELKSRISNYSVDSIILNRVMNECDFLQNRNGLWIQKKRTLKNRIPNRS